MIDLDYHRLLYTLEQVKTACKDQYGLFHTFDSTDHDSDNYSEEMAYFLKLEEDGLIRRSIDEPESNHIGWTLV